MRQLHLAFRTLLKTPFVSVVAVLSLGLGIGANTAIFSIANAILIQPLPVEAPEELVNVAAPGSRSGSVSCNNSGDCESTFSYPMFLDLSREQQVFAGIAAHRIFGANVGYQGDTLPTDGIEVSGSYFGVLGLQPAEGRLIGLADTETIGGAAVVVLSYDYWITRFERDPDIVGERLVVNGQPMTVIGVAPRGFDGTTRGTRADVFVPITMRAVMEPPFDGFGDYERYWAYVFARLQPDTAIETARAGLDVTFQALLAQQDLQAGADDPPDRARHITLEDGRRGQSYVFSRARAPLAILMAVTAVVLLIACANVANLLLARAVGRSAEMAVRLSIGASRGQLVRQLLVESCLLAGLGGLTGLLVLQWTVSLMRAMLPFGALDPAAGEVSLEVLVFAAGLSIATGVLFGLFPALHATRPDLADVLKGQAGQPGARSAARFRSGLVVAQIALAMGLLTSAGLFAHSLFNVSRVDLGVDVDRLVTFRLDPQRSGYTTVRAQQLFEDLMARLRAVPGVEAVSAGRVPLIAGSSSMTTIGVEGYEFAEGESTSANVNEVAADYFLATGMGVLAGREFTDADTAGAPRVAIVNEAFARRYGIGPNPVGRRMRRSIAGDFDIEIVGLVRDAKYNRVKDDVPPVYFLSYRQNPSIGWLSFYVRTAGDPEALIGEIRPIVAAFDPDLPVQRLQTMADQISQNVAGDRLLSVLSASFAGLATVLAAIGLYGVLAYTVSQRTREFGLRMALGASPAGVRRLVFRHITALTLVGGVIGIVLAIVVGRFAQATLYEMGSADPMALAVSAVTLMLVAFGAGIVPSVRAARIDPMRALRWE